MDVKGACEGGVKRVGGLNDDWTEALTWKNPHTIPGRDTSLDSSEFAWTHTITLFLTGGVVARDGLFRANGAQKLRRYPPATLFL